MTKKVSTISSQRKKKLPAYRSFRKSSLIKADAVKKTSSLKTVWRETWQFLWLHKYKMLQFVAIYTVTYLILVKGFSDFSFETGDLRDGLREIFSGNVGAVLSFLALYASLFSSLTVTTNDVTNYLQISVLVVFSLAFIWLVRKLHLRNSSPTVKDSFYQGMRPLIPFIIIIGVLMLEMIPAGIGSLLYVASQATSVISSSAEVIAFSVLAILGIVLTVYLLAGSIFALYIVTLPNMKPMVALRSSMRLLRIHRWVVLRRIVGFYILLFLLGFVLVLPFIIWIPKYTEIAFFVMSCASFAVMHTFMYKLYRSML